MRTAISNITAAGLHISDAMNTAASNAPTAVAVGKSLLALGPDDERCARVTCAPRAEEVLREAGRETGRDCAPDASRATGRRRSSVGSVPMTMRPSRRAELTGGGVVVSNDGRRAPVDALGSGSLYADHTSELSELSRSRPLSFAPITMRRVG